MEDKIAVKSNFSHVQKLGDYNLIRPLGIGGMGEVYLARRESDNSMVAIKLLLPSLANNRYHIELFLKEINMLGQIQHDGIVRVLEAGVQDDVCFFVMDYIDGNNLVSIMEMEKTVSETAALAIIREVAMILKDVYEKYHIIHRDIKPENIMITRKSTVHVLDFGLSWAMHEQRSGRCPGIGTAHFAAPEQQHGLGVDFRADIYSLGTTLYQLLTGKFPYECHSIAELKEAHLNAPIPDPRELRPDLSAATVALIKKSLAKDPGDRYRSWNDMIKAIDKALEANHRRRSVFASSRGKYLIVALILSLAALVFMADLCRKEQQQRRLNAECAELIKTAEELSPQNYEEALNVLDEIPLHAPRQYLEAAAEVRKMIESKLAIMREREREGKISGELKRLREQSFKFEEQQRWREIKELWQNQLEKNQFKNDGTFASEARRQLDMAEAKIQESRF